MIVIKRQRQNYRKVVAEIISLINDVQEAVSFIQDPPRLKESIRRIYIHHVTEKIQAAEIDPDVGKEYKRQRAYLEKSVEILKKKLSRDMKARKNDNMRVMQENVALIKEINKMRREIKMMHQVQRQNELNSVSRPNAASIVYADSWDEKEAQKIIDMQKTQIDTLRFHIEESQTRLMHARPASAALNK